MYIIMSSVHIGIMRLMSFITKNSSIPSVLWFVISTIASHELWNVFLLACPVMEELDHLEENKTVDDI